MSGFTVSNLDPELSRNLDRLFGVENSVVLFNPGNFMLPPHHEKIQQQILDFTVREEDIWLLSYPRTGSTWCQEMIWCINNNLDFQRAKSTLQQIRAPLLEMSTVLVEFADTLGPLVENSVKFIHDIPSPRYIKSHLPLALLPTELAKVKPKIIYTYRNPKDVAVSYYYHCKMVHHLDCPFEEFADLFLKGQFPLGALFEHYTAFWNMRNEENVLLFRYEDMKRDLKGSVRKLAKFLGKNYTEEQFDSLCDFLSFEKMRENQGCNVELLFGKGHFEKIGEHFIRKGQIGDWKNHMSPELAKRFDEWIEENTKCTGMNFD